MRIATFNLENLDDGPGVEPPLAERIPVLGPQLERLDADVLCLQEVNAQKEGGERVLAALERLLEATSLRGYRVSVSRNRQGSGPSDKHNLVTLSRLPVEATEQLWHDLVPAPVHRYVTAEPTVEEAAEIPWDRPLLYTRLTTRNGRRLHLFNVHFRAPLAAPVPGGKADADTWNSVAGWAEGYYLAEIKRAGQALELRLALDQLFAEDEEALICIAGDFNSEEHHTPIEILRGEGENTGNGRLSTRVLVPVEHALAEDRRFTVIHGGRRQMLDHLLVSKTLLGRFRASEIHNEALADELVGHVSVDAPPVSYHAPVVAVFDV